MTEKIVGSFVRHVLTTGGGAALMTGDQTNQLIGAISVIIGIIWSIIQKKNQVSQ